MKNNYLVHFGVKGQKWGLRQWQNKDGTLTPAGREHYGVSSVFTSERYKNTIRTLAGKNKKKIDEEELKKKRKERNKKILEGAAITLGAAAVASYGAYKYSEMMKNKAFDKATDAGVQFVTELVKSGRGDEMNDAIKLFSESAKNVSSSFKNAVNYNNLTKHGTPDFNYRNKDLEDYTNQLLLKAQDFSKNFMRVNIS